MRLFRTLTLILGLFSLIPLNAQKMEENVEIGEILKIGNANNYQYSHVKLPRPNFIIKTGGIPNYDKLEGVLVEVTEVKTDNQGDIKVILKRKDGKKFFNSFPEIKADYNKAIASKELLKQKSLN